MLAQSYPKIINLLDYNTGRAVAVRQAEDEQTIDHQMMELCLIIVQQMPAQGVGSSHDIIVIKTIPGERCKKLHV